MTEIPKFIHTPDGKLKEDIPWWQKAGEARIINPYGVRSDIGSYTFKEGEKVVVDEEFVQQIREYAESNKRHHDDNFVRVRFVENQDIPGMVFWTLAKHLEPIE